MTRLFIHSTEPGLASRIKPEIYQKIVEKREALRAVLQEKLAGVTKITLEIGCGHGHFLTAYGHSFPNECCVGIDVNRGRIFKARRKADRAKLNNVQFLECDSMEFLSILPPHLAVANIWLLYPDPWPKKRHFKNRIVQPQFLENLAQVTIPHGRIYLRSDYTPYMEWSSELLQSSGRWQLLENVEWPELTSTVFQELTKNRHTSLVAELKPAKKTHQNKLTHNGDEKEKSHGK